EKNLPKGSLYIENGAKLEEKCKHISNQERKATDAERESIKYKQVEFMEKHVGEDFLGVVNGIADFGVFVEVKESRCEGMISFDHMDQSYDIGEGRLSIRGRRDGKVIRMGDEVKVRVLDTDIKRRQIELMFLEGPLGEPHPVQPVKSNSHKGKRKQDAKKSTRRRDRGRHSGNMRK
ncbi:MAG: S1 RNA-binding domain-containing protein, partial [Bacteroidota bacterium]